MNSYSTPQSGLNWNSHPTGAKRSKGCGYRSSGGAGGRRTFDVPWQAPTVSLRARLGRIRSGHRSNLVGGDALSLGLFRDHDSGLVPGIANVPEERRVRAVADTDDLEVGFSGAPTEKQHRRVWVTPSRCPDQALHILELIMDCFGPKRCRDVLFGRAPDEGRGDLPLEKCRGAQAHEPEVPAKL